MYFCEWQMYDENIAKFIINYLLTLMTNHTCYILCDFNLQWWYDAWISRTGKRVNSDKQSEGTDSCWGHSGIQSGGQGHPNHS